jgi:cardiolipin synthase
MATTEAELSSRDRIRGSGQGASEDHGARLRAILESSLPCAFLEGNSIVALRNGDEIFPPMLEAIERAERSIDFETFVYWHGDIARRFGEALSDAARRGVRVRVLLDAVGAMPMPDEIRNILEESPAEVRDFHPPATWKFWTVDHRTHRKVLVCDDEGFTGGVGIAEEWTGDARNPDEWRDTHVHLKGPGVEMLRATFLGHWLETAGPEGGPAVRAALARRDGAPVPAAEGEAAGQAAIQLVRSTGGDTWTDVQTLVRVLIASAQERIRIATAYFVPEPELVALFRDAVADGVEVEILHPGPHTDHRIAQLGGESLYAELLDAGVRIFRYQPTMFHTKAITVDGVLSTIGSANFNQRSIRRDDEICMNVLDRDFTAILDGHFDEDLEESKEVHEARDWSNRSLLQRVQEWFATHLRPEM